MTHNVLPRSLSPLPLESLPGYLLRLAHRLDLSPARIGALTGLTSTVTGVPVSRMFALEPDMATAFAHATRLSSEEVAGLTLARFSHRFPPLDPGFCGRQRSIHGIFVKENWVFARASRYCPDCLAGDGTAIQQRHGGAWNLLWRLPIVFACPTHQRLLEHACPVCGQPAHHRVGHAHILPLTGHPGLHPAQCRTPVREPAPRKKTRACGARLDDPSTSHATLTRRQQRDLIDVQPGLLDLLLSDNPVVTTSAGQHTTPQRYIVDLRILVCLITASWPTAQNLLPQPVHARLIDDHVRRIRDQIRAIRDSGRDVRELALYDTPPLDAATCAVLLALAGNLLSRSEPIPDHTLRRLVTHAPPGMQLWLRQYLAGDGYCSPALHTALGIQIGSRHICERVGYLPRPPVPAPRPARFEVRHIPQHLLPEWYAEHLERFATTVKPRLLRRAAAARLAQICLGGPATNAAQQLGIPRWAAKNALTVVDQQLRSRPRRHAFDTAIEALADQLNTTDNPTDFSARRQTLRNWAIPHTDWNELTCDLREKHAQRHSRWPNSPFIDWDDSKRLLASIWIWTRITHGEHIFAPAIRPDINDRRPGGPTIRHIHTRWAQISADQPRGHYIPLRERLDQYADQLTRTIDSQTPTAGIAN